jgi:YfiH family protein
MIADCLPVLIAHRSGSVVAVAHAGWRGLAAGVIENTVRAMSVAPAELLAYLGPAIGPRTFEVGAEVREAFLAGGDEARAAFVPHASGKWLADLFVLARQRLAGVGVGAVYGGGLCTYSNPSRFFSHRRDKVSGRMAALIWIEG